MTRVERDGDIGIESEREGERVGYVWIHSQRDLIYIAKIKFILPFAIPICKHIYY